MGVLRIDLLLEGPDRGEREFPAPTSAVRSLPVSRPATLLRAHDPECDSKEPRFRRPLLCGASMGRVDCGEEVPAVELIERGGVAADSAHLGGVRLVAIVFAHDPRMASDVLDWSPWRMKCRARRAVSLRFAANLTSAAGAMDRPAC